MNVTDYLNQYHNGNKAEFARSFSRLPQNVTGIFNNPDKWQIIISDSKHQLVEIKAIKTIKK